MSLWKMLHAGGFTVYLLLACSVLSLAIIFERIFYYRRRSKVERVEFMLGITEAFRRQEVKKPLDICEHTDTPFAAVVHAGLNLYGQSATVISNAMERAITVEITKLERYTSIIGTLGSTAVYIGLFGTVLGIIRAFGDMSLSGSGGLSVVINGISEALICTAAGLAVAVPAVLAYNYFIKKIDNFIVDMELCASEMMDLIASRQR